MGDTDTLLFFTLSDFWDPKLDELPAAHKAAVKATLIAAAAIANRKTAAWLEAQPEVFKTEGSIPLWREGKESLEHTHRARLVARQKIKRVITLGEKP